MYNDKKAKAYLQYISRSDKKYNLFFAPFVDLSQRDMKRKPFHRYYSDDYGCYYECYINGREIRFSDDMKRGFGISLKPGNYTLKIIVHINHAVGNAYARDMNFSSTSFSYERHKMSDPYWTKRKLEKTWNIEIGEYTKKYLGFNGYLNGSFLAGYNQDYYHQKYDDYEELIYRLDYIREGFDFFESTKEEIERVFDFYLGVLEFDYNTVSASAYNELLLEMGEYPRSSTTSSSYSAPKTTTTTSYSTPKTTTSYTSQTSSTSSTLFSRVSKFGNSNSKFISFTNGHYYGNTLGGKNHGFGIKWTSDKVLLGMFVDGWQIGYGIEIDTNTYKCRICEFVLNNIVKVLYTSDSTVFPPFYSEIFSESTLSFINGSYSGRVYKGKPNNFGTMLYGDKSYYIGDWSDGVPTGFGIYVCDTNISIGQFSSGRLNGYGLIMYPNDKIDCGRFRNGSKC